MAYHYIGKTRAGSIVSRKSTNPAFGYAACVPGFKTGDKPLPNFGPTAEAAARNYGAHRNQPPELVRVELVDAATYREALRTGPTPVGQLKLGGNSIASVFGAAFKA